MNISSIGAGGTAAGAAPCRGTGADAEIQSLKRKLQELNAERQKAIQSKDEKKREKLERQIKEIREQIQRLRQRKKGDAPEASGRRDSGHTPQNGGDYIDVYA